MKTVFSKEELSSELKDLKGKRQSVYNKRKSLLEKYANKQQPQTTSASELHELDLKIEDIERKINILF